MSCDDECARIKRNAQLAEALKIAPDHGDDHIPYSDTTLDLFKENSTWAVAQEKEFQEFAVDETKKVHRFKPMSSNQRAFLHSLAEDYGLYSESQDIPPHRSVVLYKTPRFVSAPHKSLIQAAKLRAAQAAEASRAAAAAAVKSMGEPFNAFLLASPRFGLTMEELEEALAKDFGTQPSVVFTINFLPSDEVVIRAASRNFANALSASALESILSSLKPTVAETVTREDLARSVALCHVDTSLNITRRERGANASAGGWNTVVSRAAQRLAASSASSSSLRMTLSAGADGKPEAEQKSGRITLGLKKKKPVEQEPVDDWLEAAEKMEEE